ncbi:MAG: tetratricopeptide repeat protein [Opitutaceae bacterium]|nr:tetratricopeptide repeat protein [Cytophagales bacterium]
MACFILSSCSTFIGKFYDNTTARYNSYYLAKEKMKEVDVALKAYTKDDYHKILNIHYTSDSSFGKSQNAALEEVFKYASWSVRWHKRSKWADNNYILIGRVRHYQFNYKDGLETFKFVNSTSKSTKDKHEALICLMKFFTDFNEYDNVGYVIEYLDKEPEMTRKNKRNYLVAKAAYFQHFENYKKAHQLLDTAISISRRKHDKAKLSFINGQISEYLKSESGETKVVLDFDADKEAFDNYTATIKANPKYELWFNARLNRMRVSPSSDLKDVDKARKYYKKMLADIKNVDYKDRIYYEYGGFERRQKVYPDAEKYYKKSVVSATSNQRQKAYSYLALGEMYYDDQQRFEDAKLYYDSAIAILPKDHKGYGKIYRRQRILKEFVEHLTVVKREDSLQKLARMDSSNLNQFLDSYISKEEKRINDEAKRLAKQARKNAGGSNQNPFNSDFTPGGTASPVAPTVAPAGFGSGQTPQFYFYNPTLAAQGKIEFQQKWGRRRLEDNWRISAKESSPEELATRNQNDTTKSKNNKGTDGKNIDGNNGSTDEVPEIKINKADLVASIPLTEEKLKASHEKIQPSLFRLGKIYNQHLNEPENSVKSLQRLIDDYPTNENVPEAHYMIYLISKGKDSSRMEVHKNILLEKYPHTIYAKMILNPNYLAESKLLNKQIMARYKVAYSSYLSKNYHEADSLFTLIQTDYPDSEFEPKIELVKTIIKARVGQKEDYRAGLQTYTEEYKSGAYHDYAQQLMDKYDGKKPKEIPKDTVTKPVAPTMPDKFTPQNDPDNPTNGDMPEEVRKMYEQQMQNRYKGRVPQNPEQQNPGQIPPSDTSSNKQPNNLAPVQPDKGPVQSQPQTPVNDPGSISPPESKPQSGNAPNPAQVVPPANTNSPANQQAPVPAAPTPVNPGSSTTDPGLSSPGNTLNQQNLQPTLPPGNQPVAPDQPTSPNTVPLGSPNGQSDPSVVPQQNTSPSTTTQPSNPTIPAPSTSPTTPGSSTPPGPSPVTPEQQMLDNKKGF